jgi:NAD(P)-dependent dehydrogenase (short-subunit alcohol dehydrogenase family)
VTERVVIVGGTSGIGLSTAQRLVDTGQEVVVTGRDTAKLATALDRLGKNATGQAVDTRDARALRNRRRSVSGPLPGSTANRGGSVSQKVFDTAWTRGPRATTDPEATTTARTPTTPHGGARARKATGSPVQHLRHAQQRS